MGRLFFHRKIKFKVLQELDRTVYILIHECHSERFSKLLFRFGKYCEPLEFKLPKSLFLSFYGTPYLFKRENEAMIHGEIFLEVALNKFIKRYNYAQFKKRYEMEQTL